LTDVLNLIEPNDNEDNIRVANEIIDCMNSYITLDTKRKL